MISVIFISESIDFTSKITSTLITQGSKHLNVQKLKYVKLIAQRSKIF